MNTPTLAEAALTDAALEIARESIRERLAPYAPLLPESSPYQRAILFALPRLGKHIYAGTVPAATKTARRKATKAQRIARRQNRSTK